MSALDFKVLWYPGGDISAETEITDVISCTINKGLDGRANTVDLTLMNPRTSNVAGVEYNQYTEPVTEGPTIKQDDVLEIFALHSDDQTSINDAVTTDLITTCDVIDVEGIVEQGVSRIKVTAIDKTYNLLNKIWTSAYTSTTGLSAPEIIRDIIRNVAESQESKARIAYENTGTGTSGTLYTDGTGLFEIDARLESDGGYIQDARPDASAYPVVSIGMLFKPIYDWIEELSTTEYTNSSTEITNGTEACTLKHVYYVDKENKFHWFYPDNTNDYDIDSSVVSDDGEVRTVRLKKSTFDVVNVVFFNAGRGLVNEPILGYYFNKNTKESKLKYKYIPYTDISTNLRKAEAALGNITINEDQTITVNVTSGTTSWGESYSSQSDYEDKFFLHAQSIGKGRAIRFTAKRGSPRWKGDIMLKGKQYVPGELLAFTCPEIGLRNQSLRIQKATHQINKNSWATQLDLEEDEEEKA